MTLNEAREAIAARFVAQWPTLRPGIPYVFENEAFQEPATGSYVRLEVRSQQGNPPTMGTIGNRRFPRSGDIVAMIFTPLDAGMLLGDLMGADVLQIFEGTTFGGVGSSEVDCHEGVVLEQGSTGRFQQHDARIRFGYAQRK